MKAARISFYADDAVYTARYDAVCILCRSAARRSIFRFAVPVMERALVSWTGRTEVLAPYYGLFDLIFSHACAHHVLLCYRDDSFGRA